MSLVYKIKLNKTNKEGFNNNFIVDNGSWSNDSIKYNYSFSSISGSSIIQGPAEKLHSNSMTIAFWAKYRDFTYPRTSGGIYKSSGAHYSNNFKGIGIGEGFSANGVSVAIGNQIDYDKNNVKSDSIICNEGSKPNDWLNKWVHFAYVVDYDIEKKVYLYINGVRQSGSINISMLKGDIDNDQPLRFNSYHGWWPDALFNDINVYNSVLSQKEIQELYKSKIVDISFNNDRYIAQDDCIAGWGGTWDKQKEYFNGHAIFKNLVTKSDSWNNCGFCNKSGFKYNIPLTAKKVYISFWARLINPYSKELYGYYKYNKADGTTSSCNWRFNKSWATDSSMIGKWQHVIATADIDSSAGQTSVNCFYIYADRELYGECDYSDIQISFDDDNLAHINGKDDAEAITNQTSDYPNICIELIGPNKNILEKNNLNDWSYTVIGGNHSSDRGKGNFLKISFPEQVDVNNCTISFYANLKAWGHQNSGLFSFSNNSNNRPSDYQNSFCHQYDGRLQFNYYTDADHTSSTKKSYQLKNISNYVKINEWHLYTIVCKDNEIIEYIDGQVFQTVAKDIDNKYAYYQYIYLGLNDAGGAYRNASMSWRTFQVYNTALPEKDIQELYKSGIYITDKQTVLADSFIEDENNTQFNENKSIETKELIEYSNVLSSEIPTKVLSDGSKWAKIFHHNNKSGTILFTNEAEAKHCGTLATDDKFSRLDLLETMDFRNSDYDYEFMLEYPSDTINYNRWKQSSNPCVSTKVEGYTPIHIDWEGSSWGGLLKNASRTFITGSTSGGLWFYAIGCYTKYSSGIPSYTSTSSNTDLWVRIDNTITNTQDMNDQTSILQAGSISSSNFIEI